MITIAKIREGSIAELSGIPAGSVLISINENIISDYVDFIYHSGDDYLELLIRHPDGEEYIYEIERDDDADLGLEFVQDKIRCCGNKCIFCFIDQLPKGLRKSLYIKDEDYRLSFMDGNFITLTSVGKKDIERIIEYHLSPIYVSVHATDENLRRLMLGRKKIRPVMETLEKLTSSGIEVHTQVVLCPGYNDGGQLDKTIDDLCSLRPYLKSLGIVPVGLSAFREELPQLTPVDEKIAADLIERYGPGEQQRFRVDYEDGFLYLADEFYLLAGKDVPDNKYYDDYTQFENGIGMLRLFLDDFANEKERLSEITVKKELNVAIVTGKLMEGIFRKDVIPELRKRLPASEIGLLAVENKLLGDKITVSGLIGGKDIIEQYKRKELKYDYLLLPPNCVNSDELFLDDYTPKKIAVETGAEVKLGSYSIIDSFLDLIEERN
ncbi:MAG: DUF512 domain-containing protein [candidate division Zixibacteria bacterium]|nr:DUF512 domain-containing protein [candidate division Zixibacteria bacterium]